MGYVAVRGGRQAIEASLELLEWERVRSGASVTVKDIQAAFPDLIDQIMGESSLYAPELAALVLKQAQGSVEEAVFLLRAFRSTLERPHVSRVIETRKMHASRRISAVLKDVPGGQILGATRDYSHRLTDFDLRSEDADVVAKMRAQMESLYAKEVSGTQDESGLTKEENYCCPLPKVSDYLRKEGLIVDYERDDTIPADVTMEPTTIPFPRSARLQILARGMTQAVNAFGYAAIRGFGQAHPTVAELRYGTVDVLVDLPSGNDKEEQSYYIGSIPVTEVESLFAKEVTDAQGEARLEFAVGYGMVLGRNETKAIAMSVLDNSLSCGDSQFPTQDEEFVLYHVDSVEATGFISHLKLPHYVTFQSKLSRVRKTQSESDSSRELAARSEAKEQETKIKHDTKMVILT
ncbi:MAG: carbon-phosphorus lyase complex subunit PhnI [Raoultibacter sp.]|jgi:alpha-D-ribose 1-methylphosphonate 5-triphosphate synthase subunit PhnI